MRHHRRNWELALPALVAGLALATVAGFAGGWGWWLDLFSHFRLHYAAAALILATAALWRRRRWTAAVAAALLVVNAAIVVPALPGVAAAAASRDSGPPLKMLSLNLEYHNRDFAAVARLIRREDPDIVFLTEMAAQWRDLIRGLAGTYPYQIDAAPGRNGVTRDFQGSALLSKRPWTTTAVHREKTRGFSTLDARFGSDSGTFRLLATHLLCPCSLRSYRGQQRQIDDIIRIAGEGPEPVLMIGDLNATPWSRPWARLIGATGLKGAPGFVATWPSMLRLVGIPIDHVLGNRGIQVVEAWAGPAVGSDHRPLIAVVRLPR